MLLKSPAKINLFLKVVSKRPDGYHNLASLFQAVDLCDILTFEPAQQDSLICSDPYIPIDGRNLVNKALSLFRAKTGWLVPLKITLEKKIPYEAGLGGGSSNAATTLWALSQLSGLKINDQQLGIWGGEIGSDISFFLSQGTAYCTGRGEQVRNLPSLPKETVTIIKPKGGLSTPEVFRNLNIARLNDKEPEQVLHNFYMGLPDYFNDLEGSAFSLMPQLELLKKKIQKSGAKAVTLCGSGSALFSLGKISPISAPETLHFSASFVNRSLDQWY